MPCFVFASLCLSACLRTELAPPALSSEVVRLGRSAPNPIALHIESAPEIGQQALVGNQYLFVLLPFGSIRLMRPLDEVFDKAYSALALAGYRPVPEDNNGLRRLTIKLRAISLSGFDLLFIRRVHCGITLDAEYIDQRGATWTTSVTQDQGQLRRQAFEPQLRQLLNSSMVAAMARLMHQLNLGPWVPAASGA